MPRRSTKGAGIVGDLIRQGTHGLVDFGLGKLGLGAKGVKLSPEIKERMVKRRKLTSEGKTWRSPHVMTKPNPWVQHVRAVAKQTGMTYGETLRHPLTRTSYHAVGTGLKRRGGSFSPSGY